MWMGLGRNLFQLIVGPLCGDDADAQIPRQPPDGRHSFLRLQFPAQNLVLDLGVELLVDGCTALVIDEKIHVCRLRFICIFTVYTVDT